jgi:AP-3 complex subunit beta
LSSIRIADILQIQILGVQKCAKDRSPYVRKCAANALSKLSPRADDVTQKEMLLDMMVELLNTDTSTMVLSSAFLAFCELCPTRLDLLHGSFRKICHLLTDMDEWGQVVILDVLSRYCRKFFKEPRGWKNGTAEKIDRERRVRRTVTGFAQQGIGSDGDAKVSSTDPLVSIPSKPASSKKTIKRRVVKEGFYSDEEDESVEEIIEETPLTTRNILGLPGVMQHVDKDADEDMDLDEDHKLLLQSAMPLLKSRNAGVVLGVCSLLYYCGISSVKTRSAIGKALVRIHRGRREIQYVVLTSIRTLVAECPSAFAPFLNDFFVKVRLRSLRNRTRFGLCICSLLCLQALDPPHTRIIKVDILVSLALEPAAIEAVLTELRTYVRSADKKFVSASIKAVGRVAELARIVYDRHGQKSRNTLRERQTANRISLDCLHGLTVLTQVGDNRVVIGDAVCVIQSILTMLLSDGGDEPGTLHTVEDPNGVQKFALRRILLLLVNTLAAFVEDSAQGEDSTDDKEPTELEKMSIKLPEHAVVAALSIIGDWLTLPPSSSLSFDESSLSEVQSEIVRLVDRAFPDGSIGEKCQAVHFCSKILLSRPSNDSTVALCEHVMSMGRIDVHPDVKDCARMASGIINMSCGLKHDTENMDAQPLTGMKKFTRDSAKKFLLAKKPPPSFLVVEDDTVGEKSLFRFGTLSSLVGHQARGTYLQLPPWSDKNSPKSLRDPVEAVKEKASGVPMAGTQGSGIGSSGFYGGDSDNDSSSNEDSSSSDSSSNSGNDAGNESDSDDSSSSSTGSDTLDIPTTRTNGGAISGVNIVKGAPGGNMWQPTMHTMNSPPVPSNAVVQSSSDSSTSSDDDSSSSSSTSQKRYDGDVSSDNNKHTGDANLLSIGPRSFISHQQQVGGNGSINGSSVIDDLRGLVMAPIAVDASKASEPDIDRDSSAWVQVVRPQVGGGLSVRARFLRGPTRIGEARLKGLDPDAPNVVCVQVQFGNK